MGENKRFINSKSKLPDVVRVAKKKKDAIPKIKKKLTSFVKGEKGKISKQSMLTVGSIVGGAALGAAIASKTSEGRGIMKIPTISKLHTTSVKAGPNIVCEIDPTTSEILCTHSHHASY